MNEQADKLEPHLQRLVDFGVSGIDIMHGQLKLDLLQSEREFDRYSKIEEDNDFDDAMESMDRKYMEGYLDAIVYCYKMTYDISFATSIKEAETN